MIVEGEGIDPHPHDRPTASDSVRRISHCSRNVVLPYPPGRTDQHENTQLIVEQFVQRAFRADSRKSADRIEVRL